MKSIRRWLVAHFYPGTLEEFYAAREIQRREQRCYARRATFIVGIIALLIPLWIILRSEDISLRYKILLGIAMWGIGCIRETITEHYSLQLLRHEHDRSKP